MKFQINREKLSVNSLVFSVNGFVFSLKTQKITFSIFDFCQ
jgi:hypothetical protein